MSKVQTLRGFINQRLTSAAEEIFELFERTISEYEEQLSRSKEENERQKKLLDAVFNPEVRLQRAVYQQLLVNKEEEEDPPEQQERSPSLDQEVPAEPPHIKEEQEELWTGEQLGEPEESEISPFTLPPVPVKSEDDDGETAQSSQLQQNQTEEHREIEGLKTGADGEDCGGSDADRDCEETSEEEQKTCNTGHQSVNSHGPVTSFGSVEQHQIQDRIQTQEKPHSCSVCGKKYPNKKSLKKHMRRHSEDKCFSCPECKKIFPYRAEFMAHMRSHTGKKSYSCSICSKSFAHRSSLATHLKRHREEKPFSCSVCKSGFVRKSDLAIHVRSHTGEKPFSCSVCGKRFARHCQAEHMRTHTGEKPFSCSLCGKQFALSATLARHSIVHTGEKLFCCSVCGKRFGHRRSLKRHSISHTGVKPFSCETCDKRFTRLQHLQQHKCVVVVVVESSVNGRSHSTIKPEAGSTQLQ